MSNKLKIKDKLHNVFKSYPIGVIVGLLKRIVPIRKIVSFSSLPDYSDNARAFYEYLLCLDEKGIFNNHKFVWHVENVKELRKKHPNVNFVKLRSIKSIITFLQSDYVIKTHGFYEGLGEYSKRKVILLFHGMPVKKIGYLNKDDVKYGVLKADYFTVSSEIFKRVFQDCFHINDEQILITGMPRNDLLFNVTERKRKLIAESFGKNVILYLPTFRKCNLRDTHDGNESAKDDCFGGNKVEWNCLNETLKKYNQTIVIKPHPMDAIINKKIIEGLGRVFLIDDDWLRQNEILLYEFLGCSSKLITDYSSVYIDFLLLNRPICFFMPDFDSYTKSRGLVFDNPLEMLPGHRCEDFSGLTDFVSESDRYSDERKKINNILNDINDNCASENLFKELNRILVK